MPAVLPFLSLHLPILHLPLPRHATLHWLIPDCHCFHPFHLWPLFPSQVLSFFFCFQVLSSTTFLPQILSPLVGLLSQRLPDYTLKQCQSTSPFSPFPLLKISHSFPLRSLLPRAKFLTQGFKASPLALTYMFCHTLTTYLSSQMFHCSTLVAFCTHHTELGSFYFTHAMFSPWNADSPHQQNR